MNRHAEGSPVYDPVHDRHLLAESDGIYVVAGCGLASGAPNDPPRVLPAVLRSTGHQQRYRYRYRYRYRTYSGTPPRGTSQAISDARGKGLRSRLGGGFHERRRASGFVSLIQAWLDTGHFPRVPVHRSPEMAHGTFVRISAWRGDRTWHVTWSALACLGSWRHRTY
jgi:hypothetical protein